MNYFEISFADLHGGAVPQSLVFLEKNAFWRALENWIFLNYFDVLDLHGGAVPQHGGGCIEGFGAAAAHGQALSGGRLGVFVFPSPLLRQTNKTLSQFFILFSQVVSPNHRDLKIPRRYQYECPWPAAQVVKDFLATI